MERGTRATWPTVKNGTQLHGRPYEFEVNSCFFGNAIPNQGGARLMGDQVEPRLRAQWSLD